MASKEVKKHLALVYKDALIGSSIWIRIAFKSYLAMPNKFVMNTPFLYFILGNGTQPYKVDKDTVEYGLSKESGQKCGNCIFSYKNIVEDKNICSNVRGVIHSKEWCRLWTGSKEGN